MNRNFIIQEDVQEMQLLTSEGLTNSIHRDMTLYSLGLCLYLDPWNGYESSRNPSFFHYVQDHFFGSHQWQTFFPSASETVKVCLSPHQGQTGGLSLSKLSEIWDFYRRAGKRVSPTSSLSRTLQPSLCHYNH